MTTLASQIVGQHRLLTRALRSAKALLSAATALGIDAPKRRYRKRKAKPEPKASTKAKTVVKKKPARDPDDDGDDE
jgi:hypothetical protein